MKIAVIGGGLGGMAAAITLASQGVDVHLYEKSDRLGGKMRMYQLGSYHFDFGPNTITMPYAFQQVLTDSGVNADEYLTFVPLASHTQNVSATGDTLIFSNDIDSMKEQIRQYSVQDAENYDAFIKEITRIFELANKHFLHKAFFSFKEYLNPRLGAAFLRVRPFETLEKFIKRYFSHPFVVQCFLRYGTYIGSSPYKMPATFAMIAYLELVEGVYYVKGGTSSIAKAYERRLKELNVTIHLNSEVTEIFKYKYAAHTLEVNGQMDDTFHAMVVNADVLQHKKLLAYGSVNTREPSTSAIVVLLGLHTRLEQFKHHNVYFSENYEGEFDALFTNRYSEDATVYICNSSVTDPSVAKGGDNLLVLVNAPPLTKGNTLSDDEAYRYVMDQLMKKGIDVETLIVQKEVISPQKIQKEFAAFRGALYGASSNAKKSAFFRPLNRHPIFYNVFFVGGTVHPGGGSPLVVLGGYNVAKRLIQAYKKTSL